jgi:endonuclease-3
MSRPLSKKKKTQIITETLYKLYPEAECSLEFDNDPFRLLVMARLSAQCTDARVNIVSKELFRVFPDVHAMACASYEEIEEIIKPCGLFRTKAKSIKDMSVMLIEKFGGEIPSGMDELLSLPGVGRKIANLIRGDHFGLGGIVADTHCMRICGRLGFYPEDRKDPLKTERIMEKLIPRQRQSDFCHRIVHFGRDVCRARDPLCGQCPMKDFCRHYGEAHTKKAGS